MNTRFTMTSLKKDGFRWAMSAAAAAGLFCLTGRAYCDDPLTMAPPIDSYSTLSADDAPPNVSADTVFKWSEVPQNQEVPIRRAVFDRGGYQLYDTVGETIIVPFTNQNLYAMKFGLSTNGATYFVNEGDVPVLYVPQDGYLENASVPGARWYPFSERYHPSHPVFLGVAPSWTAYVDMGWYPGMHCYGGYWGETSFISGGFFRPTFGLFFEIGDRHYDGWERYHDYCDYHPAPYRVTVVNNNYYRWSEGRHSDDRSFDGGIRRSAEDRPFRQDHSFGNGRTYGNGRTFGGDHTYSAHRTFSGDRPVTDNRSSSSDRPFGTFRTDSGSTDRRSNSYGQGRTFQGTRPLDPGRTDGGNRSYSNDHNYSNDGNSGSSDSQGRTFGGRTFGGGQPTSGTSDRTYRSERPMESSPTFSGGRSNSNARERTSNSYDPSSRSADRGRTDNSDHSSRSSSNDRSSRSSDDRSSRGSDIRSGNRGIFRSR